MIYCVVQKLSGDNKLYGDTHILSEENIPVCGAISLDGWCLLDCDEPITCKKCREVIDE